MKLLTLVLAALVCVTAAYAAPFSDVPRTHWAYGAIQKAVDAGILQGYDGKFDGARLLNRYQMAAVVAQLVERMKAVPAAATATSEDAGKLVANLEALTIEFADELVMLNVKVSTLEDSFVDLYRQVRADRAPRAVAQGAGGAGFTAFASFALLMTDDEADDGYPEWDNRTWDTVLANDSTLFDMPQVSLGIDREVNPGVHFHAQFDFDSYINYGGSGVGVNEVYFLVDEFVGDIGGKVGAFALPFSMEHNGPFRTCNYTVTPSMVNSMIEQVRVYGLELQQTKDVRPGDLFFTFGVASGTDGIDWEYPMLSTRPVALGSHTQEFDDHLGFYVQVGRKATATSAFAWNLGYFDNGGDLQGKGSFEVDFYDVGLSWSNDDLLVMAQYMDGGFRDWSYDEDFTVFYLLVNFKLDERQSVTLRYDDADFDDPDPWLTAKAFTVAYNRKVTENSMLQFEYLTPDDDEGSPDTKDDLIQVRYKVNF